MQFIHDLAIVRFGFVVAAAVGLFGCRIRWVYCCCQLQIDRNRISNKQRGTAAADGIGLPLRQPMTQLRWQLLSCRLSGSSVTLPSGRLFDSSVTLRLSACPASAALPSVCLSGSRCPAVWLSVWQPLPCRLSGTSVTLPSGRLSGSRCPAVLHCSASFSVLPEVSPLRQLKQRVTIHIHPS